jgi:glycosyltransferase involved in cell wall biosynthesis
MRILMVVPEMGAGGAERLVADLGTHLLDEGHEVVVATSGGWRADLLGATGADVWPVPLRGRRPPDLAGSALRLRHLLRTSRFDVVHAHNVKAAAVAAVAGSFSRRPPLLVTLHGVPDASYRPTARILARCADEVVAVSETVLNRVVEAGLPPARVRVIENAVVPVARHPRNEARRRLELDETTPVVLCVARFVPQKRHDLLLAAWRRIAPPGVLLLAGDGPTRPLVERQLILAGRPGDVRLLGARQDVDWLLAAADALVLPTDWEGLPITVLEAMSALVPVVASAVPGVTQFGSAAVELVAPGSVEALADGLRVVLGRPSRRREMMQAAIALFEERFAAEETWRNYRGRYGVLSRRDPVRKSGV